MHVQYFAWLALAISIATAIMSIWRRRPDTQVANAPENREASPSSYSSDRPIAEFTTQAEDRLRAAEMPLERPHSIVFGDDPMHPAIRVSALVDAARFHAADVPGADMAYAGRIGAALQALPSVLIADAHRGKHLMEVVINGNLIDAADGFGKRAIARGSNGKIFANARLFDVQALSSMVNVAMVWQVASIVVAQKHLADISVKLNALRKGVEALANRLEEGRRARVTATFNYLQQAVTAILEGERSPAVRHELESCDRDLLNVQHDLEAEFHQRIREQCDHSELAGSGALAQDTVRKYEKLLDVAADLRLTIETRALGWYVLSLFPGESALKVARKEDILRSAADVSELVKTVRSFSEADCSNVISRWNRQETLDIRHRNVREAAAALMDELNSVSINANKQVAAVQCALLEQRAPTHLIFQIEDGLVSEVRVAAPECTMEDYAILQHARRPGIGLS